MENTNELTYAIAKRAQYFADLPMWLLRKTAEADITCDTRGKLIEHCLIEEFVEEFPRSISKDGD